MAENFVKEVPFTSSPVDKIFNVPDGDIGEGLYREIDVFPPEELAAEEVKIRKLVDRRIMPIICLTYTIQFLNKSSLNYASAYSIIPDLGLEGQRYSWVAAIFNFGYLFWAIPSNLLLQRLPVAKYTGAMILTWAVLLVCHVAATDYAGILVLRFLLGVFEAGITPALINICCLWFTRSEQPLRLSVVLAFSGVAIMVGALLGFGLGHTHDTALKSWQLIFLTIGLLNFVWSIIFLLIIPDSPSSAKFLTHRQRIVAVHRVSANMIGIKTKRFKPAQALEACADYKVYCLALIGLTGGVINGGISNFASALIKGFGFSGINATLLQLPTGAIEFAVVLICGFIASRVSNSRCIVLVAVCLVPFAGLLGIRFTDLDHRWSLVGCTWLQGVLGAPIIMSLNILNTNIAGHTKRALANGLCFTFYAAGNIVGANIFFAREAPRYFSAITGLCICYGGCIVLGAFLYIAMNWENRRRDMEARKSGHVTAGYGQYDPGVTDPQHDKRAIEDGFNDVTDRKGKYFRYAL